MYTLKGECENKNDGSLVEPLTIYEFFENIVQVLAAWHRHHHTGM